jgi:hypothetical protein
MHYYRKATAVFIIVITLMLPLFLEKTKQTAVVNLEEVVSASSHLSQIKNEATADKDETQSSLQHLENKIIEILRSEAELLAAEKSYSSIVIDQAVYQGGKNVSQELADKIDKKYK